MLVKEEVDMDTDISPDGLGRRSCRRKKRAVCVPDFVYQKRGGRESSSSKKRGGHAKTLLWGSRLVKIERDAAQALADFSRLAHLPVQYCPSDLRWYKRCKRTPRSGLKLEAQHAPAIGKILPTSSELRTSELDSTTSLSHGDKASPFFDFRAESPSSPLPSSKLACRAFLFNGGFASNLSIRRDVSEEVIQKPIKTEKKELESESVFVSSSANQRSRALNAQCSAKLELSGGQRSKGLQHVRLTDSKVRPLVSVASQLVELKSEMELVIANKPKEALTEDQKEARRLRRIQANRESARQTIRRKQLLCEELRKQSTSLASENDGMKQKRDMLMQELAFLRGQNYHLKTQLNLRAWSHPGSQETPLKPGSSLYWQALSVPCTYAGFPSHVFGWPRMMTQEVNAYCPDRTFKTENTGESLEKLGSVRCLDALGIVRGIPASSLGTVGVVEHNAKGICSISPVSLEGLPCDVHSTTDSQQTFGGKETGLELPRKPELESAMQARASISWHSSRGDSGLMVTHSPSSALEYMESCTFSKVSLPVTGGSSCAASVGSIPMNGQGLACSYAWRMPHVTPTVAAEARKRRKELTRKKRLGAKGHPS